MTRFTPFTLAAYKRRSVSRWLAGLALLALLVPGGICVRELSAADEDSNSAESESVARLKENIDYLASDALQGRGVGTEGLVKAGDHIANYFKTLGLNTKVFGDSPFQEFPLSEGVELGATNTLTFTGPGGAAASPALQVGTDFSPMGMSGSGKFDLPVVFVGYGVTDPDKNYDDYAGLDVKGKAVIVLRHLPQRNNPQGVFGNAEGNSIATFARKVSNAYEHGAAAVIFCTDQAEFVEAKTTRLSRIRELIKQLNDVRTEFEANAAPTAEQVAAFQQKVERSSARIRDAAANLDADLDRVIPLQFSQTGGRDFPVIFAKRSTVEPMIAAAAGKSLSELENAIDAAGAPNSVELAGWQVSGEVTLDRKDTRVRNVAAILEGEGPHANETIIIGAHYDHLGFGGSGSLMPGSSDIHNGADDNGSGTVTMLEIARRLASRDKKLPRRVMFMAFTAEERGLLGSAYYTTQPAFPIQDTVAMLNLDMVGRLAGEKLIVYGTGTATEFDGMLDQYAPPYGFELARQAPGYGPSDHASFYAARVPVLHFFTGLHPQYHRPADDIDLLNVDGMRRIASLVEDLAVAIAETDSRPTYKDVPGSAQIVDGGTESRPYFGSIPDFGQMPTTPGMLLSGVSPGGPAEKAGLQGKDIVTKVGESKIGSLEDFDSALRKFKPGDTVDVVVVRDGQEMTFKVELTERKAP